MLCPSAQACSFLEWLLIHAGLRIPCTGSRPLLPTIGMAHSVRCVDWLASLSIIVPCSSNAGTLTTTRLSNGGPTRHGRKMNHNAGNMMFHLDQPPKNNP